MSRYPDTYVSDLLSNEELRIAIEALPEIFRAMLGDAIVTAVYGLGSNLHVDLWYLPMKVGTRWFGPDGRAAWVRAQEGRSDGE